MDLSALSDHELRTRLLHIDDQAAATRARLEELHQAALDVFRELSRRSDVQAGPTDEVSF